MNMSMLALSSVATLSSIIAGGAVLFALLGVVFFRAMWKVPEPNQALLVSGRHHQSETGGPDFGFRIVVGRGVLVVPGVQVVRRLNLDLKEAELQVECVTSQGIPVGVRGVVIFKVGDDPTSIANGARRFLDQEGQMETRVHNVFAGHLRSIVGGLTVEEMIRDRARLTSETRDSSASELEKLGLIIDSLQIHEIEDPTGYIQNLARPHAAVVASQARIAQASADREATQREQEAEALKAQARRDAQIKQAAYQADVDKATAEAQQAGPLAEAAARQNVVVQQTRAAELEADLAEKQLQATVRKPADAQAYQTVTVATAKRDADIAAAQARKQTVELEAEAEAQRVKLAAAADADKVRLTAGAEAERRSVTAAAEAQATERVGLAEAAATKAKGLAEGEAIEAKGLAVAKAIDARAKALAENQDAVIGQQLAENYPAIVTAAAGAFHGISNMTVLNGADGVTEALSTLIGNAGAGIAAVRHLLTSQAATNGTNTKPEAPRAVPPSPSDN
jgi:flotillin